MTQMQALENKGLILTCHETCEQCLKLGRFHDNFCHVGGRYGEQQNYGWPHVVTPESPRHCILCGAEVSL